MATVLLKDMMETRYIINALAGRFRNCLNIAIDNGNIVDLAECKFGPECAYILNEYYSKLQFCNSTDAYLDSILKNNMAYRTEQIEEYEPLQFKDVRSIEYYLTLAKELPNGGKYKVECSLDSMTSKSALILLIMTRPDLELDIRQCASDVYDFVRDTWLAVAEHHDKYYELIPPNTVIREMQENGYFGAANCGYQKEQTFIRNKKVLPYEFGNSQIITPDGKHPVAEEWRPTAEKCIYSFQTTGISRHSGKVLRNLLVFREDIQNDA